jgi:hypothetical protein
LLAKIKQRILASYTKDFPQAPISSTVFLDPESGEVRIFSDGKDVTPPEFMLTAQSLARQTLIDAIKTNPPPSTPPSSVSFSQPVTLPAIHPPSSLKPLATLFLFWGYHIFYLFYVGLLVLAYLVTGQYLDVLKNITSQSILTLIAFLALIAVPGATMLHAVRAKASSAFLSSWFFKVELPTITLAFILLAVSGSLIPPFQILLLILLAAPLFSYWQGHTDQDATALTHFLSFWFSLGLTAILVYAAILWFFYVPGVTTAITQELLGNFFQDLYYSLSQQPVASIPLQILSQLIGFAFRLLLLLLSLGALLLPLVLAYLSAKRFQKAFAQATQSWGELKTTRIALFCLGTWLIIFVGTAYNPVSSRFLNQLADYQKAVTFQDKQALATDLVVNKADIQKDLETVYDNQYRYFLNEDSTGLSSLYQNYLFLPDSAANTLQQTFLVLAYPLVYHSAQPWDQAQQAFVDLFGHGIWQSDIARYQPSPNVKLSYEHVEAITADHGLLATITIEHTYKNTVWNEQEVISEFVLPPQSVVTGLKLGPNLEFPGQIAPRGAAQDTYQQQLQQRRDPALLETIGPNTYRLRVYPIPAQNSGQVQKVAFTYTTLLTPEGYPLPRYIRHHNLQVSSSKKDVYLDGTYLTPKPDFIPADPTLVASLCQGLLDPLTIDLGVTRATLEPNLRNHGGCQSSADFANKVALVIDVSAQGNTIEQLKNLLQAKDLEPNEVPVYRFNTLLSEPQSFKDFKLANAVPFGRRDLKAIAPLLVNSEYDRLVLVLGDNLSPDEWKSLGSSVKVPLDIVLTQGGVGMSVELQTTLLQSNSRLFTDASKALSYALTVPAASVDLSPGPSFNVAWETVLSPSVPTSVYEQYLAIKPAVTPAGQLAQSLWLQSTLATNPNLSTNQLAVISAIHRVAQNSSLVTPYSSLIALVNQQQQDLLDQLSQGPDRFDDVTLREAQPAPPIQNAMPFDVVMGNPLSGLMGVDVMRSSEANLPKAGIGDVMMGGGPGFTSAMTLPQPAGFRITDLGSGLQSSLFILANVVLLGGAAVAWLLHALKSRRRK